MQRFGEKLRRLRSSRGMTLKQLANELGYKAYSHIIAIELGQKRPTAELVLKAAYFFDVTTDQLMKDELELD